jgi:hypothetical protein
METGFDQLAEALYKAPFVCLAHNMFEEGVDDPVFTYANKAALELFEADWDSLVGLPSRLSAESNFQEVGGSFFVCVLGGGATGWVHRRLSSGNRVTDNRSSLSV